MKILLMKTHFANTYIFVPGGWHGGWSFDSITAPLTILGNKCTSLTLPGLEDENVTDVIINLDTHIRYVIDFILEKNISNIILCGHSYAGMVITGVADRIPERIKSLVYIDAYVPKNGDSCWSLTSENYRDLFVQGAAENGFTVAVPPGPETRRRPHPLATFMQCITLSGKHQTIANRTFIYLTGWEQSPFKKQYEDLNNSGDWNIETVHCAHNIMRENPDKLVEILSSQAVHGSK
jgi:pimeloyl-ACP methyl ester carboxylesterase